LTEDSGSTALDYSGNGNDGTANGAGPSGTGTVSGPLGQSAYDFDGTDDWVDTEDIEALDSYTLSAWVYSNELDGSNHIIVEIAENNSTLILQNSSNNWELNHESSSPSDIEVTDSATAQEWTLLTGTWDGNTIELFVDALSVGTASVSTMRRPGFGGGIGGDGAYWDGAIADVRIYDRALSPSEVSYLYEVSQSARLTSEKKTL